MLTLISSNSARMSAVCENTALVSTGSKIFVGYITGAHEAVVSRLALDGTVEQSVVVGTNVLDDAHNGISIGVDPLGYVHAAWDMHNVSLKYCRSSVPGDLSAMVSAVVSGQQSVSISYPRFYRAGSEFYLLFRDGSTADGDEWVKRWTSDGWVDLAIPLICGKAEKPADNPYFGSCIGGPDGALHVIWTHRVGWYNYGVYYARYSPSTGQWTRADGSAYALPIRRSEIEAHSLVDPTDGTIPNLSLGVTLVDGAPHTSYAKHVAGHVEVFHARYSEDVGWIHTQVTSQRLLRLRACPHGPQDGIPRPCDMEMQGLTIQAVTAGLRTGVRIFHARSVGTKNAAWQRPTALIFESFSDASSGFSSWSTVEISRETSCLGGEIVREANGLPLALLQELVTEPDDLWLWHLDGEPVVPAPRAAVSARLPIAGQPHLELPDSDAWSSPKFSLAFKIQPNAASALTTPRTMALIDKGGLPDAREYRVLLWGNAPPFVYDPARVQVLLGGPTGWALLWHPEVRVVPGERTHLVITYDEITVCLYKNGVLAAIQPCSVALVNRCSSVLIGANKTGLGVAEREFVGDLAVEFYGVALSPEEVGKLYRRI